MQDLTRAINDQSSAARIVDEEEHDHWLKDEIRPLHTAAKRWAAAALDTYEGELLRKALAVSAAIGDFTSALAATKAP